MARANPSGFFDCAATKSRIGSPIRALLAWEPGHKLGRSPVDSFTHAFTGILCAQAVRRERPGGLALGAAVVAASAADLDWWTVSMSMTAFLERHRGVAHAIAAIPFVAVAVAACFHGLGRGIARRRRVPAERFWSLLPLCLLAATTHPLLDSLNPYGLRPF